MIDDDDEVEIADEFDPETGVGLQSRIVPTDVLDALADVTRTGLGWGSTESLSTILTWVRSLTLQSTSDSSSLTFPKGGPVSEPYVVVEYDDKLHLILQIHGPFDTGLDAERFATLRRNTTEHGGPTWIVRALYSPMEWTDWEEVQKLDTDRLR